MYASLEHCAEKGAGYLVTRSRTTHDLSRNGSHFNPKNMTSPSRSRLVAHYYTIDLNCSPSSASARPPRLCSLHRMHHSLTVGDLHLQGSDRHRRQLQAGAEKVLVLHSQLEIVVMSPCALLNAPSHPFCQQFPVPP